MSKLSKTISTILTAGLVTGGGVLYAQSTGGAAGGTTGSPSVAPAGQGPGMEHPAVPQGDNARGSSGTASTQRDSGRAQGSSNSANNGAGAGTGDLATTPSTGTTSSVPADSGATLEPRPDRN